MGMFDYVKCDYPLPDIEVAEKWNIDLKSVSFQTKDMDNCLEEYIIKNDGELYIVKNEYKWVDDDNSFLKGYCEVVSSEEVKAEYHGMMNFYHYEHDLTKDDKHFTLSIDFLAKFVDNKLVDLKVLEVEEKDITEYKLQTDKLFEERKRYCNKWYIKYIFNTKYVLFFRKMLKNFIHKVFKLVERIYHFTFIHL